MANNFEPYSESCNRCKIGKVTIKVIFKGKFAYLKYKCSHCNHKTTKITKTF